MKMTRANAKALNIINPHDSGLDGYILMRDLDGVGDGDLNDVQWSYNYENDFIPSNSLDFLSVAIHEIGHTLGFVSGLDQADWLAGKRYINEDNEDDYYSDLIGNLNNATPVDMLRFSRASYEMSGDDENWIDMSIGGNPYLSFTGSGGQAVAYFATGESSDLGGDGNQASHWKQEDDAWGIMDPVLVLGQRREITELDTQLFDAIGWDIKTEDTEDVDLDTIHTEAKEILVEKITVAAEEAEIDIDNNALTEWVEGELEEEDDDDEDDDDDDDDDDELDYVREIAEVLTPDYLDLDENNYDDRGEKLHEMITNSGEVYEWGWKGYWWGWKGYWWGWKGYWQSANEFDQDGFWQNLNWQTIDVSNATKPNNESSSQGELPGLNIFDISGDIVRDMIARANQTSNYSRQNQDLLANQDRDSLLNTPEVKNAATDFFSTPSKPTDQQSNSQELLSGSLMPETLLAVLTKMEA